MLRYLCLLALSVVLACYVGRDMLQAAEAEQCHANGDTWYAVDVAGVTLTGCAGEVDVENVTDEDDQ